MIDYETSSYPTAGRVGFTSLVPRRHISRRGTILSMNVDD